LLYNWLFWYENAKWIGNRFPKTNQTDRHDIVEILFESGVKHHNHRNKINEYFPWNIIISIISWMSDLLLEETGVPEENHEPAASHWQTLLHNAVSSTPSLGGMTWYNIMW
jgi:hypothetical protein